MARVFGSGLYYSIIHRILYQVTPLYVAEISPENLRGRLLSFFNLYAAAGSVVSS
jgi:MFS family permease